MNSEWVSYNGNRICDTYDTLDLTRDMYNVQNVSGCWKTLAERSTKDNDLEALFEIYL